MVEPVGFDVVMVVGSQVRQSFKGYDLCETVGVWIKIHLNPDWNFGLISGSIGGSERPEKSLQNEPNKPEGAIAKLAAARTSTVNDSPNVAALAATMSNFGIPLTSSSMSIGFTIGFMKG